MNSFTNIYECTIENEDGAIRFFVTFSDVHCIAHKVEVTEQVYTEFQDFIKLEKRQKNHFDRHIEHRSLNEEELLKRSFIDNEQTEDIVINKIYQDALNKALRRLSDIQRRRIILYFEYGFTYEKIAKIENCSKVAVMVGIERAKEKLSTMLKKYFEEI